MDQLYKIKPLAHRYTGSVSFKLKGAPNSTFVSSADGIVLFSFVKARTYTFALWATNEIGQEALVEDYTFVAAQPHPFEVKAGWGYEKNAAGRQPLVDSRLKFQSTTSENYTFAVGEVFRLPAIDSSSVQTLPADAKQSISYTIEGAPQGFLVDPSSGYVQGSGTSPTHGYQDVTLYAVDNRRSGAVTGARFSLRRFRVQLKVKDTASPANGPHGRGCSHGGQPVDPDPFDGEPFTCDCSSTRYKGANCDTPTEAGTAGVTAATVLAVLVVLAGAAAAAKHWRTRRRRNAPFKFAPMLHQLQEDGILADDRDDDDIPLLDLGQDLDDGRAGDMIPLMRMETPITPVTRLPSEADRLTTPREIAPGRLTILNRIGGGNFGDVFDGMLVGTRPS